MRRAAKAALIIVSIPAFLVGFAVVHELGHTLLARILGDPQSVFYLVQIEAESACFGCNIYDPSRLSWGSNVVVSLGGLLATQLVALACLMLLRVRSLHPAWRRLCGSIALGFALLDVPVQVIQGLLYNLKNNTWPTNVDLMDFMLLVQAKTGAGQLLLKICLLAAAVAYLSAFLALYRRNMRRQYA